MAFRNLADAIERVEGCQTVQELKQLMKLYTERCGFAAYSFVDLGDREADIPFHLGSTGQHWENTYVDNGFVSIDPIVPFATKLNTPFCWSQVVKPPSKRAQKPAFMIVMEAAWDFGFNDGLLIPHHTLQPDGNRYATATAFFWSGSAHAFNRTLIEHRLFLQLLTPAWTERVFQLLAKSDLRKLAPVYSEIFNNPLTKRETDVLRAVAAGGSARSIARDLGIGQETVNTHKRSIKEKLRVRSLAAGIGKAAASGWLDLDERAFTNQPSTASV